MIRNADSGKGKWTKTASESFLFFLIPQDKKRTHWIDKFGNLRIFIVMGIKGRRVHMIEELSETIISFQRGKQTHQGMSFSLICTPNINIKRLIMCRFCAFD